MFTCKRKCKLPMVFLFLFFLLFMFCPFHTYIALISCQFDEWSSIIWHNADFLETWQMKSSNRRADSMARVNYWIFNEFYLQFAMETLDTANCLYLNFLEVGNWIWHHSTHPSDFTHPTIKQRNPKILPPIPFLSIMLDQTKMSTDISWRHISAVKWLKYCLDGVKHYSIKQSWRCIISHTVKHVSRTKKRKTRKECDI